MRGSGFLAVDQGNSFFKLTLYEDMRLMSVRRVACDSAEEIFSVVDEWKPACGAFCSVGRMDPRLVESLRLALDGNLLILSHSTPLPISIAYSTPSTLGLDRVALAAGAVALHPGESVVVVDAGTAVTIDAVSSSGTFMGGRISPGLRLRFGSLQRHTAALPLVEAEGPLPLAGDSTETAIRSGVVLGLADEIVEAFRCYREAYGSSVLLLTGGDAELLYKRISTRIPASHIADLMARGLLYIYQHNELK